MQPFLLCYLLVAVVTATLYYGYAAKLAQQPKDSWERAGLHIGVFLASVGWPVTLTMGIVRAIRKPNP